MSRVIMFFFTLTAWLRLPERKAENVVTKKYYPPLFFSFRMTFYKKDIEVNSFNDIFAKQRQSIARKFFSALYTAAAQIT